MSTLSDADLAALLEGAKRLALQAAEKIMEIYRQDFLVRSKTDQSPLTEADLAAHTVLEHGLKQLEPRFPVLSEESSERVFQDRMRWKRFWLVDPLDGTREFIKKNGEFTINIALIEAGNPVLGVVHAPALGFGAVAARGAGAQRIDSNGKFERTLSTARYLSGSPVRVAVSRSHHPAALSQSCELLGSHQLIEAGSALKFISLADGLCDLYPRLGAQSCEWDIAAGHCVVREAGGVVLDRSGQSLRYNQGVDVKMPAFIAAGDGGINWCERLQW